MTPSSRKSRFVYWILGIHLLAIFPSCIQKNEPTISPRNLKYLKDKYSTETLNYFYETVFHEDGSNKKSSIIQKWKSNPSIAILGHSTEKEIGYVKRAIRQINKLNLPISLSLAGAGDSASIQFFFWRFKRSSRLFEVRQRFHKPE